MTTWGYVLIAAYVGLGLSSTNLRKAMKLMAGLTVLVVSYALVSYGAL